MTATRKLQLVTVLTLPLVAFTCDRFYTPIIHNTLDRSIVLSVRYSDGKSISWEAPPDSQLWSHTAGVSVEEIEVRSQGEVIFKLGKDELDELTRELPPRARVKWEIGEGGVTPTIIPDRTN